MFKPGDKVRIKKTCQWLGPHWDRNRVYIVEKGYIANKPGEGVYDLGADTRPHSHEFYSYNTFELVKVNRKVIKVSLP